MVCVCVCVYFVTIFLASMITMNACSCVFSCFKSSYFDDCSIYSNSVLTVILVLVCISSFSFSFNRKQYVFVKQCYCIAHNPQTAQ